MNACETLSTPHQLRGRREVANTFPEVASVREKITPYAFELLLAQLAQALRYEYEAIEFTS